MKKKKSVEEVRAKAEEIQSLFEEILVDNEEYKRIAENIDEKGKRLIDVMDYYYGDWINDREIGPDDVDYDIFSEDHIYDAIQDQYKYLKKINNGIKKIMDSHYFSEE